MSAQMASSSWESSFDPKPIKAFFLTGYEAISLSLENGEEEQWRVWRLKMTQLLRPLRLWPRLHLHCCSRATFNHLPFSPSFATETTASNRLPPNTELSAHRYVHRRSGGLRLPNAPTPSDFEGGSTSGSDSDSKKSRNEKKREARRAVRWGMELASLSAPEIKRVLRVACLGNEVLDALMLAKRLGPDVREGKRRQFNYIGKLLREVQPELMDALIQASKDGDWSRLQTLSDSGTGIIGDEEEEEAKESEYEEEDEASHTYIDIVTRWFDGLINKDIKITNEVYSIHSVEFDRQELRKLVRRLHSIQECEASTEENEERVDAAIAGARKSLTRFLRSLAKRIPTD